MVDISQFTTEEMVDDYYASKMDLETCERLYHPARIVFDAALKDGIGLEHASVTTDRLEERIAGNKKIMEIIEQELERRGELNRIGKGGENDS